MRRAPNPSLGRRRRTQQTGLTLVELLVSMVILGFMMALVSEAIFQVSLVTRAADTTTRGLAARWGAGWSASSLFANLVAPQELTTPAFEGTGSRLSGYTSTPLDGGGVGIQPFELSLRINNGPEPTTDLLTVPGNGARGITPTIAVFPGRAEFAFIDDAGRTVVSWPALTRRESDPEDLPRTVIVRDASSGEVLMWYGFQGETTRQRPTSRPFAEPS